MKGFFVPDVQRTQADACREVSTLVVDRNISVSEARDTRYENENVDVLPLDQLMGVE